MATYTTQIQTGATLLPAERSAGDVVVSLIDERTNDVVHAIESRRIYDFRLPRNHVGRRRHPKMLILS